MEGFRFVKTGDGSLTLFSSKYGETMHSVTGALEEALKKFVLPANISGFAERGTVRILDVGFGIGLNSAAAIHVALQTNKDAKLRILGLEKHDFRSIMRKTDYPIGEFGLVRRIAEWVPAEDESAYNLPEGNERVILRIIQGDAVRVVRRMVGNFPKKDEMFDVVFLDAFSQPKNPELWEAEFMGNIFKLCRKGAYLTTFSCARTVRENLIAAGFTVMDGPRVGRRGPSTVAVKK